VFASRLSSCSGCLSRPPIGRNSPCRRPWFPSCNGFCRSCLRTAVPTKSNLKLNGIELKSKAYFIDNNIAVDFGEPLGNPEDENLLDENTSESPIIPEKQEDKINYDYINAIGKVSKIYSAHNVTARFATGQEIDYNGKKVRFQGNLVEYHSVNAKILDIFTNIQPNALHHQGYSNFVFENSKIYIEVCYYEDMVTGEILEYELRYTINPVYEKIKKEEWQGEWYAKSFSFTDLSTIKE